MSTPPTSLMKHRGSSTCYISYLGLTSQSKTPSFQNYFKCFQCYTPSFDVTRFEVVVYAFDVLHQSNNQGRNDRQFTDKSELNADLTLLEKTVGNEQRSETENDQPQNLIVQASGNPEVLYYVATTSYSVIEIDPPHLQKKEALADWFNTTYSSDEVEKLALSNYSANSLHINETSRSSIIDMLASCTTFPKKTLTFVITGTITPIYTTDSLWYQACPKCNSTFKLADNGLNCINCNEQAPTCVPRAKVKLQVTDSTGQVDVKVFGEDNKIVNMLTTSLLEFLTKENNVGELKDIIETTYGRSTHLPSKSQQKITSTPYLEVSLHPMSMKWKRNWDRQTPTI